MITESPLMTKEDEVLQQAILDPLSAMRGLIKNNLFLFIQYFWSEYSEQTFSPNWHIEYICKELEIVARRVGRNERKLYDLIINVPPGTTKTAMISIMFPLWCWVNWFHLKFITASYTHTLSLESAEYSRDIVRSDKWKAIFPEIEIKEDKDTKSNFRVVKNDFETNGHGFVPRIKHGGNRFSTSVNGTVTGFHGNINIVDDPIDPNGALSEQELKKTNHWVNSTLPSRKVDKKTTVTILVMQRLHQNDPTGHLLKIKPGSIKHICLPGEINNYRKQVQPPELVENYSKEGLLDVNRLDQPALDEFLLHGQYTYGSQIGQDPVPLGGGMFKTDKLSIISRAPDPFFIVDQVRYWDKAGTEGGNGATTSGVKMSKLKNGRYVIENVKRGRWSSEVREEIIKITANADSSERGNRTRIGIEQEPGSGGKESAESTVKNLAGHVVQKDRPVGNKVFRADPFSVQVNLGNVDLVAGPWNTDYLDEMKNFPFSTLKDQIDATSGAFAMLTKRKKATAGRQ